MEEAAIDVDENSLTPQKKLGFIGAGNMANAIVQGLLKSNSYDASQIYLSHPSAKNSKKYSHLNILNEVDDNEFILKNCDTIVLAVKPQMLESVCGQVRHLINTKRHLIVSICAGVNLEKLSNYLTGNKSDSSNKLRIVRCCLNTAALIGSSCSFYCANYNLSEQDKVIIEELLSNTGPCMGLVKESDMDPAMAVSSCGIAYVFMMADAMADGGVKMGLNRDLALRLSFQTIKGAGELMQSQYKVKHHMQMKDEVCSAGGTTIQGVHELERNGFRNSVICAVEAATNRAKQL